MSIYVQIVDHVNQEKKYSMAGQMSLFDMASDDQKEEFLIRLPDVGEYSKENLLAFKRGSGDIYQRASSGRIYEEKWRKMIPATTADFQPDEETGRTGTQPAKEIIGGMITDKTVKHTKTNQMMAFVTVRNLWEPLRLWFFPETMRRTGSIWSRTAKYLSADGYLRKRKRPAS